MKEATIVKQIRSALETMGCLVRKNHGGPMAAAGWPDLTVIIPPLGRHVYLEVKVPGNDPTKLQLHTIDKIKSVGGEAYVVVSRQQALLACFGSTEGQNANSAGSDVPQAQSVNPAGG